MPICIRGTVIGVVQMINKKTNDGVFTSVRFIYFCFLEYTNVFFVSAR